MTFLEQVTQMWFLKLLKETSISFLELWGSAQDSDAKSLTNNPLWGSMETNCLFTQGCFYMILQIF